MLRRFAILGLFTSAILLGDVIAGSVALADEASTLDTKLTKLGYAQGDVVDNIRDYRIDGWNYLDDKHIMIYSGASSRTLITLQTSCYELSGAENLGFSTTARNLTKFDKVVVRGPGGIPRQCQISEIRQLNSTKNK
ncbi:MAG: hypothetical protein JWM78_1691 [Verrucomicrobiaceae bacterium]|nr:hypothetical protein [Verrucomicrobiaceae bacterium]